MMATPPPLTPRKRVDTLQERIAALERASASRRLPSPRGTSVNVREKIARFQQSGGEPLLPRAPFGTPTPPPPPAASRRKYHFELSPTGTGAWGETVRPQHTGASPVRAQWTGTAGRAEGSSVRASVHAQWTGSSARSAPALALSGAASPPAMRGCGDAFAELGPDRTTEYFGAQRARVLLSPTSAPAGGTTSPSPLTLPDHDHEHEHDREHGHDHDYDPAEETEEAHKYDTDLLTQSQEEEYEYRTTLDTLALFPSTPDCSFAHLSTPISPLQSSCPPRPEATQDASPPRPVSPSRGQNVRTAPLPERSELSQTTSWDAQARGSASVQSSSSDQTWSGQSRTQGQRKKSTPLRPPSRMISLAELDVSDEEVEPGWADILPPDPTT